VKQRRVAFAVASIVLLFAGLTLQQSAAVGQQAVTHHKYFLKAAFTADGMKNLQKQSATVFRAGVAKFFESVGGKLESWYFDYAESAAYAFVDYPDEISAAAAQATVNAAGLAHVTYRPVLSAEDADKALAKSVEVRPPQQQ
jgi:uncharacterized protein with GYD domain